MGTMQYTQDSDTLRETVSELHFRGGPRYQHWNAAGLATGVHRHTQHTMTNRDVPQSIPTPTVNLAQTTYLPQANIHHHMTLIICFALTTEDGPSGAEMSCCQNKEACTTGSTLYIPPPVRF